MANHDEASSPPQIVVPDDNDGEDLVRDHESGHEADDTPLKLETVAKKTKKRKPKSKRGIVNFLSPAIFLHSNLMSSRQLQQDLKSTMSIRRLLQMSTQLNKSCIARTVDFHSGLKQRFNAIKRDAISIRNEKIYSTNTWYTEESIPGLRCLVV